MGRKTLTECQREEPERKRPRTDPLTADHSTEEVEVYRTPHNKHDLIVTETFTSKVESLSLQQIKHRIEWDDELRVGPKEFLLYPAFKEALLRLVHLIEAALNDQHNTVRMILVHGVPNVGKSSLAQCLAYLLALSSGGKETTHYMKLRHSSTTDNSAMTEYVTTACSNKYLIVDQVNTNSLIRYEIYDCIESRLRVLGIKMPLIMFTSGHYTPSEEWLNMQKSGLCYKIITMQIDSALVSKLRILKGLSENGIISNDDLLKVTTGFARMNQCLVFLKLDDSSLKEDALRDKLYPGADLRLIQRDSSIHFIWLAFQQIISQGLPPLHEFTEDHCKIKPYHVEYLGYLVSQGNAKDRYDKGINAILNLMDITGSTLYEKNGYTEFKCDSYCYKFLHRKNLHEVLRCALKTDAELTPEEKHQRLLDAYSQLTKEGDTQYTYLRGGLFEIIISGLCRLEAKKSRGPVGLMFTLPRSLVVVDVDSNEAVANEIELCSLPQRRQVCKEKISSFWCELNVSGRPPFKGYDFAYMLTKPINNKPVVEKLQLFQATVNPSGKSLEKKMIMADVLDRIKTELVKQELMKRGDGDQVVVPYFVHPSDEPGQIDLPYSRYSQSSVKVDIISFPQKFLVTNTS